MAPEEPPEKPRFSRGIKLGRVRRVKVDVPLHKRVYDPVKRRKVPSDIIIGTRKKTVGYEDFKTHKALTVPEISSYKSYKRQEFESRLAKLPEGAPQRAKRTNGGYHDRLTGRLLTNDQIKEVRKSALRSQPLPPRLLKAADTVSRHGGVPKTQGIQIIRDWYVKYETGQVTLAFPKGELYPEA